MIAGDFRILYIKIGDDYIPIGCLTSNGFSETLEMLSTSTRENGGWRSSRPSFQGFSCDFEGIQERNNDSNLLLSYNDLKEIKRSKALIDFRLETNKNNLIERETFTGYITQLSETASVGDLITFSGSVIGVGIPVSEIISYGSWTFDTADTYDSASLIFNE